MPPLPGTAPEASSHNEWAQCSEIDNLPCSYVYLHTPLPSVQFFHLDAYGQDSQHDADLNPDLLTDEGTSTGYYTICCVVMQRTSIVLTRATNWVNLQERMCIDRKGGDFWASYHLQSVHTVNYILPNILICIITEHCNDQRESKWKC